MAPSPISSRDLTRTTLGVLFIAALIVATAWIVFPFLSALLWAATIVISTWPVLLALQASLWGKRALATTVMTLLLLLTLVVPLAISVGEIVGNMDRIVAWGSSLKTVSLPGPPHWVASIPIQGPKLAAAWEKLASEGPDGLAVHAAPYVGGFLQWIAGKLGGIGGMILQFLVTVLVCAILYTNGEAAARAVRRFAHRLAGPHGEKAAVLAANSVRGVAMGVVVTAIVQAIVATIGLAIASVPGSFLLGAVTLILCLAQLGPALIVVPAVIWKFHTGPTMTAGILLVFALLACTIDNVLRPILIRKGADMSLILILTGVIGGMISLGVVGIFVGPVILVVTQVLLKEWVASQPLADSAASAGSRDA
ncbi:MAG TPA: AI-2E family transporter YdiK [Candidatus Acidoferrales bacterium]|nr:AI-2E family transporter YdiK [Candidatus Acidoferrales bacterium]